MEIKILMKADVCSALQNVNTVMDDTLKKIIKSELSEEFNKLHEKLKILMTQKEYLIKKLDELKNFDIYYFLED